MLCRNLSIDTSSHIVPPSIPWCHGLPGRKKMGHRLGTDLPDIRSPEWTKMNRTLNIDFSRSSPKSPAWESTFSISESKTSSPVATKHQQQTALTVAYPIYASTSKIHNPQNQEVDAPIWKFIHLPARQCWIWYPTWASSLASDSICDKSSWKWSNRASSTPWMSW